MLHFIQQTLQIGKVTSYSNMAYFRVGSQKEIKKNNIFRNAPLILLNNLIFYTGPARGHVSAT